MTIKIALDFALDDAATSTQTSTIGEPCASASWTGYFLTGNWYASRSADAGRTWQFVDPFTEFPQDRGLFCCDQLVRWCQSRRVWIWLLQYSETGGTNVIRVAVSKDSSPGSWRSWLVTPADLDPAWRQVWFDYPDVGHTDENLWISFNLYTPAGSWRRSVVMRYLLDQVADVADGATGTLDRQHWSTVDHGSLRFVNGAADTMWWASNDVVNHRLDVFAWPDDEGAVEAWAVEVSPWDDGDYTSFGPGNAPWLARLDDRVTGGWRLPARSSAPRAPARLGFLWTSGRTAQRPHPFIRAVTISETDLTVVAEPDLWSANGAWAYPAAAASARGRVGLAAFFGGGGEHPAHVVGILDERTGIWSTKRTAVSTHGPSQGKWGDYLTVQPHVRRPTSLVASGFTLQGGQDRRNIEPRVVVFRP